MAGGDQVRRLSPGHAEACGAHRVQPQGADRVPHLLAPDGRDVEVGGGDLRHRQLRPAGALPAGEQELRHRVQHDQIRALRGDQDVPHLLPDDAHPHEAAQDVPVGQRVLRPEGGPQAPEGTLRHLRLHPVRKEEKDVPLRALVAPLAEPGGLRNAGQAEKVLGLRLLLGREKVCPGRDIALRRLLRPVQDLGQQQPVLPRGAAAVQQLSLFHGQSAPVSAPAPRRRRSSPSAPRGCPAP